MSGDRGFARYAAQRLAWAVGTAAAASVVAFVLFWAVPNVEPEWALGGREKGTNATRAAAREKWGLDKPLPVQYVAVMRGIFDGSLQCHFACGNLRDDFVARLPVTAWIVAGGALLAAALATGLALLCVRHHGRRLDRALLALAAALQSVPSLVLSVVLWTLLAQKWEILPYDGYTGLTEDPLRWAGHLAGPWIAVALPFAGAYVPIVRAALLDAHRSDWVRTARAKGLSERRVLRRHVLRTSLAAPVSIAGLDLAHAFGGLVLYVETIFRVPGVGDLTESALQTLDLPAVVALSIWLVIVVVVVSALFDLLLYAIDPRTRTSD
ncbi:MAG TPA: ABC transporter permease [Solirubrobacteraceae bacterium]